ncbi:MAG: SdrD B-like domain-containing protein [Methanothrix soehngenii]|uniref:SdrD B-like domain-containing protein n=1 Tax=Methanothrix soehngenii TaxID=2223 RepID=UPI0031426101
MVEAVPNNPPEVVDLASDLASPQIAGTAVTFTAAASDPENDPLEFMFLLDGAAQTEFTSSPSWTWTTTVENIGPHTIEVRARDNNHNPEGDSSKTAEFVVEAVPNNPPEVVDLASDLASPQIAGTAVTFTAAASDPENDTLEFMFLLDDVAQTEFTSIPSWTWTTTEQDIGSHTIEVRARDNNHNPEGDSSRTAEFVVEAAPNNPPEVFDLASDLASPQIAGTAVTFTAAASDPENDTLEFMFLLDDVAQTEFTSIPSWTWTTTEQDIGSHTIEVRARDNNHNPEGDSSRTAEFVVEAAPNNPPELMDLAADLASPQLLGSRINWTATASDAENDTISYRFLVNDTPVTDWQPENLFAWTATEAGTALITVQAKDDQHDEPAAETGSISTEFVIIAPEPAAEEAEEEILPVELNESPSIMSLAPDLESPQVLGSRINWTATASDAENDTISYRFLVNDTPVTDWQPENLFAWTATEAGTALITVQVKDDQHDGPEGESGNRSAEFAITMPLAEEAAQEVAEAEPVEEAAAEPNESPSITELSADLGSPQVLGSSVNWTAVASDPEDDPISYRFLVNETAVTDWQAENKFIWTASEAGSFLITAQARDDQHEGPEGDSGNRSSEFVIVPLEEEAPFAEEPAEEIAPAETNVTDQVNVTAPANVTDEENATAQANMTAEAENVTEVVEIPEDTLAPPVTENITTPIAPENITENLTEEVSEEDAEVVAPVVENQTPVLNSLIPDIISPQKPGVTVTWTANATDVDMDPLLFRFFLNGPATNGAWEPKTEWISDDTWAWVTSSIDRGENQVKVQVRDGQHSGEDGFDSEYSGYFTLAEPKMNISGLVYEDKNGNGVSDSGEALSGWTVQITKPDQSQVSVLTREDGTYSFQDLDAGSYTISETLPSGWVAAIPEGGSHNVDLSEGDVEGLDFVNKLVQYTISGRKFNDLNGNGAFDGEPGMEGWTIELSRDGSLISTATTEKDGSYKFAELSPGSYTVSEVEQAGWTRTAPPEGSYTVELTDGDVADINFGNHGSFAISGTSFLDSNGNGVKDEGEPGRAGVAIQLSRDGSVINATTTLEDGSYAFRNLSPGTYSISQVAAEGINQIAPEGPWTVELKDADVADKDFANSGGLSISGQKYYDINGNGLQDEDEPGIPGGEVSLVENGKVVANTTTDENGLYSFENVLPGTYTINDPVPTGMVLTTSSTVTVTIKTVVVTNVNFGIRGSNSISGMKYEDLNGDSTKNPGEKGLSGWEMVLTGSTWFGKPLPTLTATTDNNGNYKFERLLPGTYKVSETSRTGWTQTAPAGGSHSIVFDVRTPPREAKDNDFGNRLAAQSISGVKYNDINGNGVRDPGEPGMGGWKINLEPAGGGVIKVATTEADGSYSFTDVASGTYTVREIHQPGWDQKAPASGTYTVTLDSSTTSVSGKDFGNWNPLPANPSLIPDKSSPQRSGTPIIWTARADDLDPLQYRFLVRGPGINLDTGYSSRSVWTWNTLGYPAGKYEVEVWIRDGQHSGPGGYDVKKTVSFSLTGGNLPPSVQVLYTDRPEPQYAGSWIKWTAIASDPDRDPLQYRFFLRGPATRGFWVDMTGWGKSNQWIWRTTPADVGYSEVLVAVRDGKHAGPAGSDDYQVGRFFIMNVNLPPVITGLGTNLPSAQPVGATIRWAATASDPEGNPLFFRYWMRGPSTGGLWRMVRDWSTDPTWTWPTTPADAGTSEIKVQVRDGLHSSPAGWDDDAGALFTVRRQNLPPTLISLGSDKPSSQKAGTPVTWTAIATDPDMEPLLYRFWLKGPSTGNSWKIVQDWSYKNQWTWASLPSDGGAYTVYVYVRDGWHNPETGYDSAVGAPFILAPNQPPVLTALKSDRLSPQGAGTPVKWTAAAIDADKDPIYYRFWLKGPSTGNVWQIAQDWSLANQWTWSSMPNDGGAYTVYVYARDGWHYPDTGYDSALGSSYQLISNQPPVLTALKSDRPSPQGAGTPVKWTATASDADKDPLYYQFWLKGPSTGNVWRIVQSWSAKNQWTWSSAPTDAGNYRVYVYVRDGKHAPANAYDSAMGQGYMLQDMVRR